MSTRSGDLDPGLVWYLARTEKMSAKQFNRWSISSPDYSACRRPVPDMHDLLERETQDVRAAEAVALFCYQVKKWVGASASVLGGLDTLVFAGGIGENAPEVPGSDLRGAGIPGHRARRKAKRGERGRHLHGHERGGGPRYSHGRRTHDSQDGVSRPGPRVKRGELNHGDQYSFCGTAPQDGCLLACC